MNAEVFDDAADHIEKNGWMQKRLTDGQRTCLLGAVYTAAGIELTTLGGDRVEALRALTFMDKALIDYAGRRVSVPFWNDEPERTEQDALDFLRYCAKKAAKDV